MAKRYSEEFRSEAVRLVIDGGVKLKRAASDLGVSEASLSNWIKEAQGEGGMLSTDEREELKRLRKENLQLRMERDILKKATAYFARDTK